jgi:hypothetical protein
MKKHFLVSSLTLSSIFFLSGYFHTKVEAQTFNPSQPTNFQRNERDASGLDGGVIDGFNPLDLIHNSNFQRRSPADFQDDSNQEINRAAEEFKRQQLQKLQNTEQQKPAQ